MGRINYEKKGLKVDINREQLAIELKTYRLRRMLTQQELAKLWNLSRYTLLRAEKGKPVSWETAYTIFYHLNRGLVKEAQAHESMDL